MSSVTVQWTGPASKEIKTFTANQTDGIDPVTWHENKVIAFAAQNVPTATKARIRKPAHTGGTDPNEPEHITVTFKKGNKEVSSAAGGAWHVYTGR